MKHLRIMFVVFFVLNLFAIELASAQYYPHPHPRAPRGPRYDPRPRPMPIPPPHHYPRPTPGYPRPGNVVCEASDRGWEEHWNGHNSCGSCLQHHGDCVERCSEQVNICESEGISYNGSVRRFQAAGPDRWMTESEAIRNCEWNRDMRACRIIKCSVQSRTISTRSCR